MQRFKTLLLREWMQHQRGWWVLMALPFVLIVVAGLFGQVQFDLNDHGRVDVPPPVAVALAAWVGLGAVTLLLAWLASMLQSPGLARRDAQDRSIEFWLSLPIGHAQSLGATLLMHLLLWPWLALLVGLAGGAVASLLIVSKAFGVVAWFALPWATLVPALLMLALRVMLGVLLATLWLSPLILGTMAASAWLKRWGVPLVVAGTGVAGLVLDKVYANPVVWQTLHFLSESASRALIVDRPRRRGHFEGAGHRARRRHHRRSRHRAGLAAARCGQRAGDARVAGLRRHRGGRRRGLRPALAAPRARRVR